MTNQRLLLLLFFAVGASASIFAPIKESSFEEFSGSQQSSKLPTASLNDHENLLITCHPVEAGQALSIRLKEAPGNYAPERIGTLINNMSIALFLSTNRLPERKDRVAVVEQAARTLANQLPTNDMTGAQSNNIFLTRIMANNYAIMATEAGNQRESMRSKALLEKLKLSLHSAPGKGSCNP